MTEINSARLVVVTGGTKGIGRSIIHKFAAQGFTIVTCSRNAEDLQALKDAVEASYGVTVHVYPVDMSQKPEVTAFIEAIKALNLPLEVLVNNTGRFVPGEILKEDDGVLEAQIETNLYSAYWLTRGLAPLMQAERRGYIFNMCSTASIMAYSNGGSYCISKFALYGMSKVLREEMKAHGVRVSSVMPGPTLTASWEGVDLPAERFIDPDDVAELVLTTYQLSPRTVVEDLLIRPQLGDL